VTRSSDANRNPATALPGESPAGDSGESLAALLHDDDFLAIDAHGAGMHQRVVISSDGAASRKAVGDEKSPVRWLVIGVVDEQEPGGPV